MSLSRFLYTLLMLGVVPLMVLRLLIKSRKDAGYRQQMGQRFGLLQAPNKPIKVWIHAVSVGETIAAKPLIEKLIQQYGEERLLITNTTPTGRETTQRLFGDRVANAYFPYDIPWVVKLYIANVQPQMAVMIETEIWPNLWSALKRQDIPVFLINARLSARATRRYSKIQSLFSETIQQANTIACRNDLDRARFIQLGALPERVNVVGDIKLDIQQNPEHERQAQHLKRQWGEHRKVLTAASTHEGEDALILDVFQRLKNNFSDLLLILVPRHPERFDDVYQRAAKRFRSQKRSHHELFESDVDVVVGDSMGEMMLWYTCSDMVVMGGSFVSVGGHNPIEPIVAGAAVLSGPHVFNFQNTYSALQTNHATYLCDSPESLEQRLSLLLADDAQRKEMIVAGENYIHQHQGAVKRNLQLLQPYIG